jgi:hypothetical protein
MDVHKETISIAVINSAGKLVIESISETTVFVGEYRRDGERTG